MKKSMVLLMVIGMVSSAGAGMYITVGPEGGGVDIGNEYTMGGSENIWLGIHAEDMPGDGQFGAALSIADNLDSQFGGDWTGDNNIYIPPAIPQAYNLYIGYTSGFGDIWYLVNNYDDPCSIGSDGLHADFEFHAMSTGDILIELVAYDCVTVLDTLIIHNAAIPETLISFNPHNLSFSCRDGGQNPAPQTLSIWKGGSPPLHWEITESCDWLAADPCNGVCGSQDIGQVAVSVDASGLTAGVYNCNLIISDPCAVNSPQTVPVELQVFAPGDFDMDGDEDGDDLHTLALAWMSSSGGGNWNPDCDISDPNDEVIDGKDFGVFAIYWEGFGGPAKAGMDYQIEACDPCDPGAKAAGPEKNGLRFSATVEGNYICFEDMMYANCCPDEMWLDMEVTDNQITVYEHAEGGLCDCMCNFPVMARFIGSTVVVIE
jgi:hypothetical protein